MFRGFRFSLLLLAGAMFAALGPPAAAQNNAVAPPPPPREGTVGPEQLRDFSLGGASSRRPEPAQAPAPEQRPPADTAERASPPAAERRAVVPAPSPGRAEAPAQRSAPEAAGTPGATATRPGEAALATSLALPPPTPAPSASFDFNAPPAGALPTPPPGDALSPEPVTEEEGTPTWPWLLAFAVALGGAMFLWSRRRTGEDEQPDERALAFAGGVPPAAAPRPEAQPAAVPAPTPSPVPSHPKGVGIVSTRLRPWLDADVQVAAAALSEDELQLQLLLIVANNGSVPARQVGVEVVPMNAGAEQEGELAAFFGRADPEPLAAEVIAPLEQAVLQTTVRMPRTAFREYAAGEGRVLVPLVALNVSYRAGGGTGRTSRAFLIGRGSAASDKLGPLRTDPGPREFRGLVARPLPGGIRR